MSYTGEIEVKIASFNSPGEFAKLLFEEGVGNVMPIFGLDPQMQGKNGDPDHWAAFFAGLTLASLVCFGAFHTNLIENLPSAVPDSFGVEVL